MDLFRKELIAEGYKSRIIIVLMSDLHLEATDHDRGKLLEDLAAAKKLGARIAINGDMFDAITPTDAKRFHSAVNKADASRDDKFNQMIKVGFSVLKDYADDIDLIAPGNHERSVLKYHHLDLTGMLIALLNQVRDESLPPIHQGSYRGFMQYVVRHTSRAVHIFNIFRHHGSGGSAPVTGGALDLDRIRKDFDADLYWIGHKHTSIERQFTRYSMSSQGNLIKKPQRGVISAGYKKQLTVENPNMDGDEDNFSERFYQVSEQGSRWLLLETLDGSGTTNTGYINGVRWSVFDSPYGLITD